MMSRERPSLAAEWHQFRLLSRDSVRRLLNLAWFDPDADPAPTVLWLGALVTTPPTLMAFARLFEYGFLRTVPTPVYDRTVLGHRLFFVTYAMLTVAMLTAVLWEALLPDRSDLEIVAPLAVRPRTIAAARLAAASTLAVVFAAATSIPSAVLFGMVSASHRSAGSPWAIGGAHLLASTTGGLVVFCVLASTRALLVWAAGTRFTDRLAFGLQLTMAAALVEGTIYLPSFQPALAAQVAAERGIVSPPAWAGAWYTWLAAPGHVAMPHAATQGLAVLLGLVALTVAASLVPAGTLARRALASSPARPRARAIRWTLAPSAAILRPVPAALWRFTLATLLRSSRHRLVLASYVGGGIALGSIGLVASWLRGTLDAGRPSEAVLAVPLALLFFGVVGLRAVFTMAATRDANWTFRLVPPDPGAAIAATRAALVAVGVLPVVAGTAAILAWLGWPSDTVWRVGAIDFGAGVALVNALLVAWRIVPFTCAWEPSTSTLRTRWAYFLFPCALYVLIGARVERVAIESTSATLALLALVSTTALVSWRASSRTRANVSVAFEVDATDSLQTLDLSDAVR
ncbi:MAG: hypothetical protein U0Q12_14820 [Vicinamibacterales bacterium]